MKKTNTKRGSASTCKAKAGGGTLSCVLAQDHGGAHSTQARGAKSKAPQYATWLVGEDGAITVTMYLRGKKLSEWTEQASPPPVEASAADPDDIARAERAQSRDPCRRGRDGFPCQLPSGHEGDHLTQPTTGLVVVWNATDTNSWLKCRIATANKGYSCECPEEHDGPHRQVTSGSDGLCVAEWADNSKRTPVTFVPVADAAAALLGRAPKEYDDARGLVATAGEAQASSTATSSPTASSKREQLGAYEVHPAAAIFPMIEGAAAAAFVEDIRANGQRTPIVRIMDGEWLILDGRNRLRACLELGLDPKFRTFGDVEGDGDDPIAFVISENLNGRRHLNETQRAFVGAELVPLYEAQAKERQRAAGGDRRSEDGRSVSPNSGGAVGKATELAARAVNVGRSSIEAALKVTRDAAPEVLAAAKDRGQLKVSAAADLAKLPVAKQREIVAKVGGGEVRSGKVRALVRQERKREIVRQINTGRVAPMPAGQFGVIYGDYPWLYENSDQHEGSRGHMGYPPMAMEEILSHAREAAKRGAKDCVIALWVTNLYVREIGRVIDAYGAVHHTMWTWPKPRAGVGTWGRGQTEHLVIASIGNPTHTLNEVSTLLPAYATREHSRKPDEVAELLAKHCTGPFLELFAREPRAGWATWGAEADGAKAIEVKRSKIYTQTDALSGTVPA